jgi:putative ATPase
MSPRFVFMDMNRRSKGEVPPLAERMRPASFDEFFGQGEAIGEESFVRKAVESDSIPSLLLWGPPGSGKTTLANIIAATTRARFVRLSAVECGKKDLREVVVTAKEAVAAGERTILFLDEIHRWNKAQQDSLLPYVERGLITLIGATTENPSFEVVGALLSRCRVIVLRRLEENAVEKILERAAVDVERGLGNDEIVFGEGALSFLARMSGGDARAALNILEACASQSPEISIDAIRSVLQRPNVFYDKNGEEHYNIISALHKSMRGGDPDASVYWLARMLEGGEDPLYIARRLVRFASEDVGLANNSALLLANSVFDACHKLGMPECGVHLAHCVIYLARSAKSIDAYEAYRKASSDVRDYGPLPVPIHLRNAPTKLMRDLDYGKNYRYTPLEDSSKQEYFPEKLRKRKYLKKAL